jgi:pilus assembly protein Flp/PilA
VPYARPDRAIVEPLPDFYPVKYRAMSGAIVLGKQSKNIDKFGLSSFPRAMKAFLSDESGQDIAEYAVMLAVILVVALATIRLIGTNAGNVFSNVASSLQ